MEELFIEKKTRSEYRLRKFKKAHDYDSETGTIKMDDGKRLKFKYNNDGSHRNEKSLPYGGINEKNSSPSILMNKKAFNMKNPKAHEYILKHEYGHKKDYELDVSNPNHINNKEKLKAGNKRDGHDHDPREYVADYYAATHIKDGKKVAKKALRQIQKEDIKTAKPAMKKVFSEIDVDIKKSNNRLEMRKSQLKEREQEYAEYVKNHKDDPRFKAECSNYEQIIDNLKGYITELEQEIKKHKLTKQKINSAYADQISGFKKRNDMSKSIHNNKDLKYVTNESAYDSIYESLQERVDSGVTTLEFAEKVNELAYNKYVIEAEEDHQEHMKRKRDAEQAQGKELKNKKYIKDSKKADLIYSGREKIAKKPKWHETRHVADDKKFGNTEKVISYMKKVGTTNTPEDDKKYLRAKKILDNVTKSPEGSDINSFVYHDKSSKEKISGSTSVYKGAFGSKVKLDKSRKYYHCTDLDGLKELRPQFIGHNNTFVRDDKDVRVSSALFYPKKRIYITSDEPDKNFGKHGYELLDVPNEGYPNRFGFYIEPERPVKVKQIF